MTPGRDRPSAGWPTTTTPSGTPLRLQVRVRVRSTCWPSASCARRPDPHRTGADRAAGRQPGDLREGLQLARAGRRPGHVAHGIGRFLVAAPETLVTDISRLRGVSELLPEHRIRASVRLLESYRREAADAVAAALAARARDAGHPISSASGHSAPDPSIYSVDILPEALLGADWTPRDFQGSLLELIETRSGRVLGHAQSDCAPSRCRPRSPGGWVSRPRPPGCAWTRSTSTPPVSR